MKMMNENFHLMILYKYIKYFLIKIYYFTLILRISNSYIYQFIFTLLIK